MRHFWRTRTFPLNSRLWKLESEATGEKKKAHCGGIYRRSRTLFVLYIAELRGVSSTFQMAFTAQTRMPLTIASRKSRLAGTVRAAQPSALFTCRVPRSHSECGGRAGFCLSKVLIVGADTVKQKHFDFLLIQIFFFLHLRHQLSRFLSLGHGAGGCDFHLASDARGRPACCFSFFFSILLFIYFCCIV